MKDKLKRAYIHKRRDAIYWFDMAKNHDYGCTREDLFYAAIAAGQAEMIALILKKDYTTDEGQLDEIQKMQREIRDLWEVVP